ncbi:nibrin [Phytophthora cinnamomi]|uniref:nibrin n=1 Tax=Phytophthora cinnamomi TaxID=4785 RepID=UPI00355A5A2B|nr:nibrin [Phytophthora cinnamomi]
MSFPEHLSLRSTSTVEHDDEEEKSCKEDEDVESVEDVDTADVTIKECSEQLTDPNYERAEVKDDTFEDTPINIVELPIMAEAQRQVSLSPNANERKTIKLREEEASEWKSARVLVPRDVKPEVPEEDFGKPIVLSCKLIAKKREPLRQSGREGNGLVNYKRFKKGNGFGSRSSKASLFPQQTVVSVVDNAEREALQENLEAMEEQERIAEELFAMGEGRTTTKLF